MTKNVGALMVVLLGGITFCGARTQPQRQEENQPVGSAGPPRVQVAHNRVITSLAWSPNGKWIATSSEGGKVVVTEAATGKEAHSFLVDRAVVAMAFASDNKALAICGDDEHVSVWNVETGKEHSNEFGRSKSQYPPRHLAYTQQDKTIVGIGAGAVYYWGTVRGCGVITHRDGGGDFAAIAPDGAVFGWCSIDGACRIFRYHPKDHEISSTTLEVGRARSIAFGPGGKLLAVGTDKNGVALWDLTEKKETRKLASAGKLAAVLAFPAEGKSLAVVIGDRKSIYVFDLTKNTPRCQIDQQDGTIDRLALSPDGKLLATTSAPMLKRWGRLLSPDGLMAWTSERAVLSIWRVAARESSNRDQQIELSAKELASLWTDMANPDLGKADRAWRELFKAGDNAIPFLREQFWAVAMPPVEMKKRIEKLVADLDSDKFALRDRAIKELQDVGDLAIVPLQRLLENPPSAEACERAKLVLKKLQVPVLTMERQRVLDAIELLEQVKTAKAIALLEEIEREALVPQIRLETRQALERLGKLGGEKKG